MRLFRDHYTLRKQRDWYENQQSKFRRWKHWEYVKFRRFFIKIKLHRRRCSECSLIIPCYGYEGIYDMCTDCYHEANPY